MVKKIARVPFCFILVYRGENVLHGCSLYGKAKNECPHFRVIYTQECMKEKGK